MASTEKSTNGKPKAKAKPDKKPKCGIVMPISDMDGYPSGHWNDVLTILETVVKDADFEVDLVSNADEVTVIHQTIVQNLYDVMFELGMRLAFDKPTIIIIDDKTDFSFDTGVISHVLYPSDLRFPKMVEFQKTLKSKIVATYKKSAADSNYSPFLRHFGQYKVVGLETRELSPDNFILEKFNELTAEVRSLRNDTLKKTANSSNFPLTQAGISNFKTIRFIAKNGQYGSFIEALDREFGSKMTDLDSDPRRAGEWRVRITFSSLIDAFILYRITKIADTNHVEMVDIKYF